jgi:hypothetical protein
MLCSRYIQIKVSRVTPVDFSGTVCYEIQDCILFLMFLHFGFGKYIPSYVLCLLQGKGF